MQDSPDKLELLQAVTGFLQQDLLPQLGGRSAYHARVALNVLGIVMRELQQAPQADAREHARLEQLLGQHGDLVALNRTLCEQIAQGTLAPDAAALIDHLWATTLDRLAIDQPGYASYLREAKRA